MPVLSICNQKGGSGETTIAVNLAEAFARQERRVALIDMDPQGTAWAWAGLGEAFHSFDTLEGSERTLPQDVRRWRDQYDLVIIDCPPQYSAISAMAIRVADLVLIPVQPSPLDYWATEDVVDLIRERHKTTGGTPPAAFVVSRAVPNSVLQRSLEQGLSEMDLPALASGTTQRTTYVHRALEGKMVFDGPATIARGEIEAMRDEIQELIDRA